MRIISTPHVVWGLRGEGSKFQVCCFLVTRPLQRWNIFLVPATQSDSPYCRVFMSQKSDSKNEISIQGTHAKSGARSSVDLAACAQERKHKHMPQDHTDTPNDSPE